MTKNDPLPRRWRCHSQWVHQDHWRRQCYQLYWSSVSQWCCWCWNTATTGQTPTTYCCLLHRTNHSTDPQYRPQYKPHCHCITDTVDNVINCTGQVSHSGVVDVEIQRPQDRHWRLAAVCYTVQTTVQTHSTDHSTSHTVTVSLTQ